MGKKITLNEFIENKYINLSLFKQRCIRHRHPIEEEYKIWNKEFQDFVRTNLGNMEE